MTSSVLMWYSLLNTKFLSSSNISKWNLWIDVPKYQLSAVKKNGLYKIYMSWFSEILYNGDRREKTYWEGNQSLAKILEVTKTRYSNEWYNWYIDSRRSSSPKQVGRSKEEMQHREWQDGGVFTYIDGIVLVRDTAFLSLHVSYSWIILGVSSML